jgi:hypothetical protein
MCASFILELYYEHDDDQDFAVCEAKKLGSLVKRLAPHLSLEIRVLKATAIYRAVFEYEGAWLNVPNQGPSCEDHQSLLITREEIGASGWAGPKTGCLSKQALEEKASKGADSADITIHEWLHTLEGREIDGWMVPNAHANPQFGFEFASSRGPDGLGIWHDWYRFALHRGREPKMATTVRIMPAGIPGAPSSGKVEHGCQE